MSYFDTEANLTGGKPLFLYKFLGTGIGTWRFASGVSNFTVGSETYTPWPIKHGDVAINMTGDRNDLQITLAAGSTLDRTYIEYPPSGILNVVIRRTHEESSGTPAECPVVWQGRVAGVEFTSTSEVEMTCVPSKAGTRRPGLRRNYQINCPLLLYGPECRASKAAATRQAVVERVGASTITLTTAINADWRLEGGIIEWVTDGRQRHHQIRSAVGRTITIPQRVLDLGIGDTVRLTSGCRHTMSDCRTVHNNIANFGGQPYIPLENPATNTSSIFY